MKRIVASILLVLMVVLNGSNVFASEMMPYYYGSANAGALLNIDSSGKATCTVTVNIYANKQLEEAYIVMTLWKHSESNGWKEIRSWSDTYYNVLTGGHISMNEEIFLSETGTYQVTSNIEVTTTAGTDNLFAESTRVSYNG